MTGMHRIEAERARQIEKEGFLPVQDDAHEDGKLGQAARAYAMEPVFENPLVDVRMFFFPKSWLARFKPSPRSRVRDLEKAGALYLAEAQRCQRAAQSCGLLIDQLDQ